MTTDTPAMTAEQIDARLETIAPHPDPGVTAEQLARYLAVRAQLGFTRNVTPFVRDDQLVPSWQICLEFAAAHLLFTLQGEVPELASLAAQQIAQSWDDGGMGEWLHEYLGAVGVDPREVAHLDEARLALENADRAPAAAVEAPPKPGDELAKLRRGGRELGKSVVRLTRSMQAARIEMLQNGPEAAMQWILSSIPDVDDNDPEDQWNGTESAGEWFDRTREATK